MADGSAAIARMQAKLEAMGKAPYKGLTLAAIKVANELRGKVSRNRKAKKKRMRAQHKLMKANLKAQGIKLGKMAAPAKGSGIRIQVTVKGDAVSVVASTLVHQTAVRQDERTDWMDITGEAIVKEVTKVLR